MKLIFFSLISVVVLVSCSMSKRIVILPAAPTETLAVSGSPTTQLSSSLTPETTATPEFSCPNAPETRLKVGDRARVTETEDPSVNLRRDPVVAKDNVLKLLSDGTELEIIGGPVCAPIPGTQAAFVFWQISIPGDPLQGWVAEGNAKGYFIELLPREDQP
jgi:hypothetical protein